MKRRNVRTPVFGYECRGIWNEVVLDVVMNGGSTKQAIAYAMQVLANIPLAHKEPIEAYQSSPNRFILRFETKDTKFRRMPQLRNKEVAIVGRYETCVSVEMVGDADASYFNQEEAFEEARACLRDNLPINFDYVGSDAMGIETVFVFVPKK
jgi:hypothetical protein